MIDQLQSELRSASIEARVIDIRDATVTVSAHSYVDFLFAKSLLERHGLTAIPPWILAVKQSGCDGRDVRCGQRIKKRRAIPRAARAAPSNITVVPPSGTLLMVGGRGVRAALAFWLNATITAQTATESIVSLFERSVFSFMAEDFMFSRLRNSRVCANANHSF
jgi:hypothetical protein